MAAIKLSDLLICNSNNNSTTTLQAAYIQQVRSFVFVWSVHLSFMQPFLLSSEIGDPRI